MATNVYTALRHQRPSGIPVALVMAGCDRNHLIFVRELVDAGRVSDWRSGEGLTVRDSRIVSQTIAIGRS